MPRDPEVDKLLYGSKGPPGGTPKTGGTKIESGESPAASIPRPEQTPLTSGIEAIHDFVGAHDPLNQGEIEGGRGVAKSLAGTATGIPRAINAGIGLFDPAARQSLGAMAERVPGVKRMEQFAAEPSQSWAETAGYAGATGAQLLAGPTQLPGKFAAGQGFVRTAPSRAGTAISVPARGAAGGAATDPENPGAGAVTGALTAGLTPGLGALAQSRAGQYVANNAMRGTTALAVTSIAEAAGLPAHWLWAVGIPELIRFYHSPLGSKLGAAGERGAVKVGGALQRALPTAVGGAAGSAAGAVERNTR
jgi:hypothetical protein